MKKNQQADIGNIRDELDELRNRIESIRDKITNHGEVELLTDAANCMKEASDYLGEV